MAWKLRRTFRLVWWVLCGLTLLALPLLVWDFFRRGMPIKYQAWFIGGLFVIMSFPISIYEVAMHTEYYTRPRLQRHVIRILWMVPIYAIDAWFALRFRDAREYLDPIRECYEAYVIYNFFAYLMAYLEDEQGDVELYLSRKPAMSHFPPFKWLLKPWGMGHKFLLETKKGVMNYVILRPLTTCIGLITDVFGKYGQGRIDFKKSYIYLIAVTNFSQMWALYCLAQFYWVCHKELAPIRPLSKFLCIKAVVFLTFWQGVILAVLAYSGVISDQSWSPYDQLGVATGIQDFLICIEMFLAALAHAYAFPPKDYMGSAPTKGFIYNVRHMFDLRDVVHDMGEVVESHVDTATEAVSQTTQVVFTVPKKAVKTVGKGLMAAAQAPESLLNYLTADGSKKPGQRRGRGSSPDQDQGDESRALLLPPQDVNGSSGGPGAYTAPVLPAVAEGGSAHGRKHRGQAREGDRAPLLSEHNHNQPWFDLGSIGGQQEEAAAPGRAGQDSRGQGEADTWTWGVRSSGGGVGRSGSSQDLASHVMMTRGAEGAALTHRRSSSAAQVGGSSRDISLQQSQSSGSAKEQPLQQDPLDD